MTVETKDKEIILRDVPRYVFSQISYWGFKRDENNIFTTQSNDPSRLLEKLIDFLDSERIQYELSQDAKELIKGRSMRLAEFAKRKSDLAKLKEGSFDRAAYEEFTSFLSANLPRTLKEHQKKSAFHLYMAMNGANFSAPGSGKTSVVLSVYEKLRQEGIVDTLFVIGPPSSFGPWKREFEATLGRIPKCTVLAGGDKGARTIEYYSNKDTKSELYLSTYQTVLNDQEDVVRFLASMHVKSFLVVDEAHYMKRLSGNWAQAVLRLAKFATIRCALTGTPLPRNYSDVFNLFEFLWPDHKPISEEVQNKILLAEKDKRYDDIKAMLDSAIGPLFYRVRKKDLNLTEQIFHPPVLIKMNPYERHVYDAIENNIRRKDAQDDVHDIELVLQLRRGRLIRLRQAASYIGLLESTIADYKEVLYDPDSDIGKYIHEYKSLERPAKLEYLLNFIREKSLKGEKVLVWSNFIDTIEMLKKACIDAGYRAEKITGSTPVEQEGIEIAGTREKIRDEFVDLASNLVVLIANPAACAESISLHTGCHNAVYYDLSYNCAQYLQSLDRIHRVGGSETIEAHYYFFEYEHTIDEDIRNDLERKARRMYAIIDADYPIYTLDMTEDDDNTAYERIIKKQ
jgi:SNF2 family DNA or RNA helicase